MAVTHNKDGSMKVTTEIVGDDVFIEVMAPRIGDRIEVLRTDLQAGFRLVIRAKVVKP